MSSEHISYDASAQQQPSHAAIDHGNPANFKTKYLVLDDINIDLLSMVIGVASVTAYLASLLSGVVAFPVAAALIVSLRTFLPIAADPEGLVLITGGSSGIGAELAYIFARHGHDLVLVGRDEEQLATVKENIAEKVNKQSKVHTIASDLSLPGAAKKLYDSITSKGLVVSVLVNNAGLGAAGETLEQPIDVAERMVILNCVTVVQLSQLFGKDMAQRGKGWMLQVSSVGGWMASANHNIYHATKHFVRAFSEALSLELRAYPGVVNTQIMPGPTQTQWPTRAKAEETLFVGMPGGTNDPKDVASAAYEGLRKKKRMVFSSFGDAISSTVMHILPRSLHLTIGSLANYPTNGLVRMPEPLKDQKKRM